MKAEFARQFEAGKKTIVVGAGHAFDIKYFLERGVKDQRIVDLAGKHVALLKEDKIRMVRRKNSRR